MRNDRRQAEGVYECERIGLKTDSTTEMIKREELKMGHSAYVERICPLLLPYSRVWHLLSLTDLNREVQATGRRGLVSESAHVCSRYA